MLIIYRRTLALFAYVLSFLTSSCQPVVQPAYEISERGKAHIYFVQSVGKYINEKYDLRLSSEGCVSHLPSNTTRGTSFSFQAKDSLEIHQVRELSVKIILEILKLHLEDTKYVKYFYEFPFNLKNVRVSIFMPVDPPNELEYWPKIKILSFHSQHLYYRFYAKSDSKHKGLEAQNSYGSPDKTKVESFRYALNEVKDQLSLELLGVAAKLNLLDGNLDDDFIDCANEASAEMQTKEFQIDSVQSQYEDGHVTKEYLDMRLEELSRME